MPLSFVGGPNADPRVANVSYLKSYLQRVAACNQCQQKSQKVGGTVCKRWVAPIEENAGKNAA
jgi:hypothetical protein